MINLEKIRKIIRKIYENSTDIEVLQEELEDMLTAIDNLNLKYKSGKISKEDYNFSNKKFKKESLSLINKINKLVDLNLNLIKTISNEFLSQKEMTK